MAIPVSERFSLLIDGVETCYINIHYTKSHPSPDPDTFEIRTLPECAESVNYFDSVEIKKDGVTEFYGFIEEITPEVGEDGLEYLLTGRCWKLMVWKKWNERFQESREIGPIDTEGNIESGFFGCVKPEELIKFILRCPKSIHPKGRLRHKIGWGIPSELWDACANLTADCHYPQWVFLRYAGLAWRGRGASENMVYDTLVVDGFDSTYTEWTTTGASPWLDTDDDDTNKIHKFKSPGAPGGNWKEGNFSFANLAGTRDFIYSIKLYIKYKGIGYWWCGETRCIVYLYDGTNWYDIGYLDNSWSWKYKSFNVTSILNTVTKVNAAKIYFHWYADTDFHVMNVTYAYLDVEASTLVSDYQHAGDWFIVDLGSNYDDITGMLIECRNNPTMYARNYKIQHMPDSDDCPCCDEEWEDNLNVDDWTNDTVNCDNADWTYVGVGDAPWLDVEDLEYVKIEVWHESPDTWHGKDKTICYWDFEDIPDCMNTSNVTTTLELKLVARNITTLGTGGDIFLAPYLRAGIGDSWHSADASGCQEWDTADNTWTTRTFVFTARNWTVADVNSLQLKIEVCNAANFTLDTDKSEIQITHAYLHVIADTDLNWNDFTPVVNVTNNNARDILHSWEPEDDIRCIRIKLTQNHIDNPWEISQIYIWQSDKYKYRLMDEGD